MTPQERAAYLAATIDCDGNIELLKTKRKREYWLPRVCVEVACPRLVAWLVENYGGNIYQRPLRQPHHRQLYRWHLAGVGAVNALKAAQQYLITKRKRAALAVEFAEVVNPDRRTEIVRELAMRNRRGF